MKLCTPRTSVRPQSCAVGDLSAYPLVSLVGWRGLERHQVQNLSFFVSILVYLYAICTANTFFRRSDAGSHTSSVIKHSSPLPATVRTFIYIAREEFPHFLSFVADSRRHVRSCARRSLRLSLHNRKKYIMLRVFNGIVRAIDLGGSTVVFVK